jgi:hypothetical protein
MITTCAFRRRTTVDLAFNIEEALARPAACSASL